LKVDGSRSLALQARNVVAIVPQTAEVLFIDADGDQLI
jgi:hypothetical protein